MSAARLPPEPPAPRLGDEWTCLMAVGFEALLARGPVMLAVSSAFSTGVPDRVRMDAPHYQLRIGHGLTPHTPIAYDAVKLTTVLTFGGVPHEVVIPWAAVVAARADVGTQSAPAPAKPRRGSQLKLVP